MTYVLPTPDPSIYAQWAAEYASLLRPSLAAGTTGRAPMSTDVIIDWLEHYVTQTNGAFDTFGVNSQAWKEQHGPWFVDLLARDYAHQMANGAVAMEHQKSIVDTTGSDVEQARYVRLLTAIRGAQACYNHHVYGPFPERQEPRC